MGKFLRVIDGVPRMVEEGGSPSIYDETITVVAAAPGSNEILGPVTAGTHITLPNSKTYTGDELQVYLNGIRMDDVLDYTHFSSTQIDFVFDLEVGDLIRFYIDRNV